MKRVHVLLTALFTVLSVHLFAQCTFEKTISGPDDQVINQIIVDGNSNYLMAGRIKDNETAQTCGYLILLDSCGNLIQEKIMCPNDTISTIFFNALFFDNYFYILGSVMLSSPDSSKLWYLKFNLNLQIEEEKYLSIPSGRWISYMNSIIDSDTNIVITGYTTRIDSTSSYNNDAYFYKIDIEGDSLCSKFCASPDPLYNSYDIIESPDHSKYYAFVSHFTNTSTGQKLVLSKTFDSLYLDAIPLGIYDFYSPTLVNDSNILLCGKRISGLSEEYVLNVITIDEQSALIDYNFFMKDVKMREHPAMYNGVSKNGESIFVAGTSNFSYSNPFWSTFDSWFHLIKINPDITPVWEYWYGGDAYYFLYSILATHDGGCIMVGNRYDYETQDQERDIYIAKVNSEGIILWTQEIPFTRGSSIVYPNPGTNSLNVRHEYQESGIELIDLFGRVVINQSIDNQNNTINTTTLLPGVYFYRLIDKKNNTLETGKWVKQKN